MKHLRLLLYALALTTALTACGGGDDDGEEGGTTGTGGATPSVNANNKNANNQSSVNSIVKSAYWRLEFPHLKETSNNVVVVHVVPTYGINYTVEWDADKRSQRWSCYQMHNGNNVKNTSRYYSDSDTPFSQYPNDTFLDTQYHFTKDPYWNSGYDHGHICPSYDRLCSFDANYQTFFLTNMQPQVNSFNAGIWLHMENKLQEWNNRNFRDTLYVAKGGTIDSEDYLGAPNSRGQELQYIGSGTNRIPVPKYFYMAILRYNKSETANGGYKALAFWVEHKSNASTDLGKYVINIDELEKKTGIDFFCNLPDDIEDAVESESVDVIRNSWGLK